MNDPGTERILVVAPTGRDGVLTREILSRAGFDAVACDGVDGACEEIRQGAAALLIAEEVLSAAATGRLVVAIAAQPPWSDIPVVVFTGEGATIQARRPTQSMLEPLGNVTLLDRPVRMATLISVVRAAVRSRRRQHALRELLEEREEAVRSRDRFLAMLGHELRNPLGAILLAGERLKRSGVGTASEIVLRQTKNLSRLVDDLLDISRVTTGKVVLRRSRLDLGELVARAATPFQPIATAAGLSLNVAAAPGVIAEVDAVRLEQVVGNLVTNAIKYTPAGGRITVSVGAESTLATIRVRDTGVGIPPEMLGRIFELFAQVDTSLERSRGGLGIGLTLVRSLVELHGGTVEARSEGPGRGSEFVVRLSRAVGAIAAGAGAVTGDVPSRHVLLVEDNADHRETLAELLVELGHRVDTAPDGRAAVERALDLRPEVMVVDIGLPLLDGFEVARRIRPVLRDVRLVALTGYGQPEDKKRALEAGFDAHLTKPVEIEALIRLFTQATPAARPTSP